MHALELLDRCAEIGAALRPGADGELILRAGSASVPVELVRQLRDAKVEVLAALTAGTTDPKWWRREYHVRTLQRLILPRTTDEAERLAWGELQNCWYRLHGRRAARWQCAGCGDPIGGLAAVDLGDGSRVHRDLPECLTRYGERWRSEATQALVALGLKPPRSVDKIEEARRHAAGAGTDNS